MTRGRIRNISPKTQRTIDGITFASKAEMNRYVELKMLQSAGVIYDLELQPKYELVPKYTTQDGRKVRATHYVADFSYRNRGENELIVEDVKGHPTDVYKLKRKLFEYLYPEITFHEHPAK